MYKLQFFTFISVMVEDRWVYAARHFTSIESSFQPLSNRVTFMGLSQMRTHGPARVAKMCKKCAKMANIWTYGLNYWETVEDMYMLRCVWQALNPLSVHVTFTAIVPGAWPGETKMYLRLSWRSQMPLPAKRVKATTYRRDSPEVAKLWLRLVFMQLTRDLFAIA